MKIILACLICLVTSPVMGQWRAIAVSSQTDTAAITENFRRASLWSNRKLDRFSNDTLYGQPIFQNGVKFGDGTIQNTAIPSTSYFLIAPATFTYLNNAAAFLTAPATFQILLAADVIPSTAIGYYGISVATATYASHANTSTLAQAAVALSNEPAACGAGEYATDISSMGVLTCGTPAGSGDVVLASTQTFTGQNTFANSVTISSFTATLATISTVSITTSYSAPNQPAVKLYNSAAQNITGSQYNKVQWNSTAYLNGDISYSGGDISIEVTGMYFVSCKPYLNGAAVTRAQAAVFVATTNKSQMEIRSYTGAVSMSPIATDILSLSAGNSISCQIYVDQAGTFALQAGESLNSFTVAKIF